MCKKGIAAVNRNNSGRVENIRLNSENIPIGDFFDSRSNIPETVLISSLNFSNKKAEKKIEEKLAELGKKKKK